MALRVSHPLKGLFSLQQALADIDSGDGWFSGSTSNRGGFPPINIFQDKDDYVMIAEIPGIKRENVNVEVHRNRVRLSGEKKIHYGDDVSVHRSERQDGRFDRTFATPFEIDADSVKAEYQDGILALSLPRAEQDKPRSITVS
ncbi:MAG: Hsp20/alpha crystallin family protein [Proteobacteria bacterium]|nr:Hsp20/alpha crystallin family protein [Pseudomonadota bacterium]